MEQKEDEVAGYGHYYIREMAGRAKDIIRAVNLPIFVDIDTGYGGLLNTDLQAE